jgi:hypothetical protein
VWGAGRVPPRARPLAGSVLGSPTVRDVLSRRSRGVLSGPCRRLAPARAYPTRQATSRVPAFQELVERHQPLVVSSGFHELRIDDLRDVGRVLSREAALG